MPHGHRMGGTASCLAVGGGLFILVLFVDPGINLFLWLGLDHARLRAAADAGRIHSCWQLKGGVKGSVKLAWTCLIALSSVVHAMIGNMNFLSVHDSTAAFFLNLLSTALGGARA